MCSHGEVARSTIKLLWPFFPRIVIAVIAFQIAAPAVRLQGEQPAL